VQLEIRQFPERRIELLHTKECIPCSSQQANGIPPRPSLLYRLHHLEPLCVEHGRSLLLRTEKLSPLFVDSKWSSVQILADLQRKAVEESFCLREDDCVFREFEVIRKVIFSRIDGKEAPSILIHTALMHLEWRTPNLMSQCSAPSVRPKQLEHQTRE